MDSTTPPAVIGGRYRVIRLLGRGGMGKVYEVEHLHTGDRLALKVLVSDLVLRGDAVERFKREARAAARIKSDHVVRVTDADIAPELAGSAYLVMELLEGRDLEHASQRGPQPGADVALWLRQVSHGLDKAHALGIVHRDLKPENLFLGARDDGTPHVKILDFGIAKMVAERETMSSGQMIGTPSYMAPEQAVGSAVTPATDRFALGLIAFRLLVGVSYWRGETVTRVMHELLYEPMPPPSERGSKLGPSFDAWFAAACHRDPKQRFESSRAQIDALCAALGVAPAPAVSVRELASVDAMASGDADAMAPTLEATSMTGAGIRRRRSGLLFGAAAVGFCLLLFAVGRAGRDRRRDQAREGTAAVTPAAMAAAASERVAADPTPGAPPLGAVPTTKPVEPSSTANSAATVPVRRPQRSRSQSPIARPINAATAQPPPAAPSDPLADQNRVGTDGHFPVSSLPHHRTCGSASGGSAS